MIRNLLPVALICLFAACKHKSLSLEEINTKNKSLIGTKYPTFNLPLANGSFSNEDFKGKVVFINFWFKECVPCIAELDQLNDLYNEFKNTPKFKFVSISLNSVETIKELKKQYNIQYKVLSVPEQACKKLNLGEGYPCSIVLDSTGKIKTLNVGGPLEKTQIRDYMKNTIYAAIRKEL